MWGVFKAYASFYARFGIVIIIVIIHCDNSIGRHMMEKAESKPDHKGSVPVDMSDNHQIDPDLWTRQDRAHHIIAQAERVAVEGDERTRHLRLNQRWVKTLHHLLMMRYMYIESHDPVKNT